MQIENNKYHFLKILNGFQCDYIRSSEEVFAQVLSENENVCLFFINENQAFTDGKNIVVDPAINDIYSKPVVLEGIADYMKCRKDWATDPWNALRLLTRGQTIHECLHLLYTDFPGREWSDPKCDTFNKRKVMGLISNIIEDAYIEAVGCSYYDNMSMYLMFLRLGIAAAGDFDLGNEEECQCEGEPDKNALLTNYFQYMICFLLYPMIEYGEPRREIADVIQKSKKIYLDGSMASSPAERYRFCSEAFDLIAHLIPEDEDVDLRTSYSKLNGSKSHNSVSSTLRSEKNIGRTQEVSMRLFSDDAGNEKEVSEDVAEQLERVIPEFESEKKFSEERRDEGGSFRSFVMEENESSSFHQKIKINESHVKINFNLRKAYQNIYNQYRSNIRFYVNKFTQILKSRITQREEKQLFGSGITSSRLFDHKKRYWYRSEQGEGVPDLSVLLLIDGSGSMSGKRIEAARRSALILHEVLQKQGILHAIVEHRGGEWGSIDINVMMKFGGREDEKLNIMQLCAKSDNRDGLALYWAEKYILTNTANEHKLIIVLSDGLPSHSFDRYYPPASTKDTADAVKKIMKRGTHVVGVSLDSHGSFECYDNLKQIYPHLVGCNDLNRLTGLILGLVARLL